MRLVVGSAAVGDVARRGDRGASRRSETRERARARSCRRARGGGLLGLSRVGAGGQVAEAPPRRGADWCAAESVCAGLPRRRAREDPTVTVAVSPSGGPGEHRPQSAVLPGPGDSSDEGRRRVLHRARLRVVREHSRGGQRGAVDGHLVHAAAEPVARSCSTRGRAALPRCPRTPPAPAPRPPSAVHVDGHRGAVEGRHHVAPRARRHGAGGGRQLGRGAAPPEPEADRAAGRRAAAGTGGPCARGWR